MPLPPATLLYQQQRKKKFYGGEPKVGWQAATNNFVNSFDPRTKKWKNVVKNKTGHFLNNGILTRRSFFASLQF
jgi:hypothetical protein